VYNVNYVILIMLSTKIASLSRNFIWELYLSCYCLGFQSDIHIRLKQLVLTRTPFASDKLRSGTANGTQTFPRLKNETAIFVNSV